MLSKYKKHARAHNLSLNCKLKKSTNTIINKTLYNLKYMNSNDINRLYDLYCITDNDIIDNDINYIIYNNDTKTDEYIDYKFLCNYKGRDIVYVKIIIINKKKITVNQAFFKSNGESRIGCNLKGYWLPTIGICISGNIMKLEDDYIYYLEDPYIDNDLKILKCNDIYPYMRFINRINIIVSKMLKISEDNLCNRNNNDNVIRENIIDLTIPNNIIFEDVIKDYCY